MGLPELGPLRLARFRPLCCLIGLRSAGPWGGGGERSLSLPRPGKWAWAAQWAPLQVFVPAPSIIFFFPVTVRFYLYRNPGRSGQPRRRNWKAGRGVSRGETVFLSAGRLGHMVLQLGTGWMRPAASRLWAVCIHSASVQCLPPHLGNWLFIFIPFSPFLSPEMSHQVCLRVFPFAFWWDWGV